jgi:phage terminase small subunit
MKKPLNTRQQRFCEFIAAGETQTNAYLKAGFKVPRTDARKHAARLMTNDDIASRIAVLRKPQTEKAILSRDRKRELLAEIALSTTAKTLERIRAIEADSRLAGRFEPDRVEVEAASQTLMSIKERAMQMSSTLGRDWRTLRQDGQSGDGDPR